MQTSILPKAEKLTFAGGEVVISRGALVAESSSKLALTGALQGSFAHAEWYTTFV
jgi:hypothetical protein